MNDHLFSALSSDPHLMLACIPDRERPLAAWIWLTPTFLTVALAFAAWLAG
jgi:hypothetical protein